MIHKELINYSQLSKFLAKNDNSIRKNSVPEKYESRVRELEELVQHWVENRSSIRYKEVK